MRLRPGRIRNVVHEEWGPADLRFGGGEVGREGFRPPCHDTMINGYFPEAACKIASPKQPPQPLSAAEFAPENCADEELPRLGDKRS